jgi:hypothetical protein
MQTLLDTCGKLQEELRSLHARIAAIADTAVPVSACRAGLAFTFDERRYAVFELSKERAVQLRDALNVYIETK